MGSSPTVATLHYRTSEAEADANARLIAAAPAMYAALKEAVENLIAFTDDPPKYPVPYDVSVALPRLQEALATASPTPLWWEGTEYDVRE